LRAPWSAGVSGAAATAPRPRRREANPSDASCRGGTWQPRGGPESSGHPSARAGSSRRGRGTAPAAKAGTPKGPGKTSPAGSRRRASPDRGLTGARRAPQRPWSGNPSPGAQGDAACCPRHGGRPPGLAGHGVEAGLSAGEGPQSADLAGRKRQRSEAGQVAAAPAGAAPGAHLRERSSRDPGEPRPGHAGRRRHPGDDPAGARGAVRAARPTRPAPGSPGPEGLYPQAPRHPTAGPSRPRRARRPRHGAKRPGTLPGRAVRGAPRRVSPWPGGGTRRSSAGCAWHGRTPHGQGGARPTPTAPFTLSGRPRWCRPWATPRRGR
jgi:hypothetical protein